MARPRSILQSEYPYNVGARCINRDWFTLPMDLVWEVFSERLHFLHHAFKVEILNFVLMHNHYHLMVRTPLLNLPPAMQWFQRETSRELVRLGNRINQCYGGPHFRCVIGTYGYYLNAYKYFYYNPVKAGICDRVEDYCYSTLHGLLGQSKLLIPVVEDTTLFSDVEGTLNWLNKKPREENWQAVGRALRRKEFRFARVNHKPHPLEFDTL